MPFASVVRAFVPEQEVRVETWSPPPFTMRPPAKVEVAVEVERRLESSSPFQKEAKLAWSLPLKVLVAVEDDVSAPPRPSEPPIVKAPETDDEAFETKPPYKVERPETARVLEPDMAFVATRYPEKSEVALVEVA